MIHLVGNNANLDQHSQKTQNKIEKIFFVNVSVAWCKNGLENTGNTERNLTLSEIGLY